MWIFIPVVEILCALAVLCLIVAIYKYVDSRPKKDFAPGTNIVITGAAQGLGKLLATKFAANHPNICLHLLDIADNLAPAMLADVEATAKSNVTVKFYKCNLANPEQIEAVWKRIPKPVHLLVNNAAVCLGKRVDEMQHSEVRRTMDINFNSYVHLAQLFLAQRAVKQNNQKHLFHIANVISIGGHMTCGRNSDYSASKFALTGFMDALRQELVHKDSKVALTNFYPYFINTGLLEGFNPKLRFILSTLDKHDVV